MFDGHYFLAYTYFLSQETRSLRAISSFLRAYFLFNTLYFKGA